MLEVRVEDVGIRWGTVEVRLLFRTWIEGFHFTYLWLVGNGRMGYNYKL